MKYDYTIFIGRFQPAHSGHYKVIQKALELSDKLIIVIGSHNSSPNLNNPFPSNVRRSFIESMLSSEELDRIAFVYVSDHRYNNNLWIKEVQNKVQSKIDEDGWRAGPTKIALIGHSKDATSFYLKLFPHYDSIEVDNHENISGSDWRQAFYNLEKFEPKQKWFVNNLHYSTVMGYANSDATLDLQKTYEYIKEYKKEWGENVFANTVDAVVTIGGHILLIQRDGYPGKGQWALPGGFLERNETIIDGMIRELREETRLAVPAPSIRGSISNWKTYDAIDRDPRGRIITHAFHIDMKHYGGDGSKKYIELPKIKASSDAKEAKWFTFDEFERMRPVIYSDHFDIVEDLIS